MKDELGRNSIDAIINKYILCDVCFCFSNNRDLILELKGAIAKHFHIHSKEIEIVGSGKIGFSLNEERFGKSFDNTSDIDLVIVSSELFDRAWIELLKVDFSCFHRLSEPDKSFLQECLGKIHDGNLRPDKLPSVSNFGKHWWEIFQSLSSQKKYEYRKIRGRLFKNWFCVEKYYSKQLIKLKGA